MKSLPMLLSPAIMLLSQSVGGGKSSPARPAAVPEVPDSVDVPDAAASNAEIETERRRAVVLAQQGTGRGATLLGTGVSGDGRLRSTLG